MSMYLTFMFLLILVLAFVVSYGMYLIIDKRRLAQNDINFLRPKFKVARKKAK